MGLLDINITFLVVLIKGTFVARIALDFTQEMEEEDAGQPPRKSLHLWEGFIFQLVVSFLSS